MVQAMYTSPQLTYLAHWLTRQGPAEASLLTTAAQSRVDLNPHQVEAALFALRGTERSSAFAKGVLLADEVGLVRQDDRGRIGAGAALGGQASAFAGGKPWGYLLIPHIGFGPQSTIAALRAQYLRSASD